MTHPNVVILCVDSLRADTAAIGRLPFTERHARHFRAARSAGCWTAPATASIFTGRFPHEHHVETRSRQTICRAFPTLAERFALSGYATHQVTANGVTVLFGLDRGFEHIDRVWEDLPKASWIDHLLLTLSRPRLRRLLMQGNRIALETDIRSSKVWLKGTADLAFARTRERLRECRFQRRPGFVFVNLMEAHFPYHFGDFSFLEDNAWGKLQELWALVRLVNESFLMSEQMTIPAEMLALLRLRQRLAWVRLAPALDAFVEELCRRDDTIVVLCSDHGDCFGEEGHAYHFGNVIDPGNRVPLAILGPTIAPGFMNAPVSTRDLGSTLLHLAGIGNDGLDLLREPERSRTVLQAYWHDVRLLGQRTHPSRQIDQFCFIHEGRRFVYAKGWSASSSPIEEIEDLEARREIQSAFDGFRSFSAAQSEGGL